MSACALAACAGGPRIAEPQSLDHGLLIARVETHGAVLTRSTSWADTATIVALDAAGTPVPGLRAMSGLEVDGYVLFFGLPAGRYVLRGASFPARGVRYTVTPPEFDEAKRAVVLRPGAAAYLGDYGFDSTWPAFSVALGRAGHIVAHGLTPFLRRPVLPRDALLSVFAPGPGPETRALLAVRGALAGTQWRRVVDARLRELGAAEPAKNSGGLRPRELALREEAFLSWRDTLDWGEPRRAPGGLAWRRPGGSAQVAVYFTTAGAPGFAGWSAAVVELRRSAAASVDDMGGVYEVRVATRAGLAARTTKYQYPDGMLIGSETSVIVTETALVPDGFGYFTARLRAPRGEFEAALPGYREFLLQLVLGPPKAPPPPKAAPSLPFIGGVP